MRQRIHNMVDTETIDRLFLELSQFTKATTKKELELQSIVEKLEARINMLNKDLTRLRGKELIT